MPLELALRQRRDRRACAAPRGRNGPTSAGTASARRDYPRAPAEHPGHPGVMMCRLGLPNPFFLARLPSEAAYRFRNKRDRYRLHCPKSIIIVSTMPLLTIHHKTEYRYAHPVAFGEHRIMLRPRDGHDLRVLSKPAGDLAAADVAALDPRRVRQLGGDRDLRRARRSPVFHSIPPPSSTIRPRSSR